MIPTTVSAASCCTARWAAAARAWAACAICSCRACSAAIIEAIWPLIEESSDCCCASFEAIACFAAARSATTRCWLALAVVSCGPVALDGLAERLHLAEHVRVEVRDALRVVEAVDHVVEAPRPEDHLERRGLLGRVERDEPGRDRALALPEIVTCDTKFALVLLQVALDPLQLGVRGVVLRARPLERVGEVAKLPHHLLRLGPFRRDRRVGERRDCRHQGDADPRENVRRLPQPTYDKPLIGAWDGRTGRGRYVTSAGG